MYSEKTYTLQFWLLCVSAMLFCASFAMPLSDLPEFLTQLGGGQYKGLIISLFTLTALLSRPFSGKLADSIGRKPVMVFGVLVSMVCCTLYPFFTTIWGFFLLRFFHGMSTGFNPTGMMAYIGDIVPMKRRGEAMGIFGVAMNVGMAMGPPLGAEITKATSFDIMFYSAGALGLLSYISFAIMKETLPNPVRFQVNLLAVKKPDLIERRVLVPSLVMILTVFSFGAMQTIIPDFSDHLGLTNRGLFYPYFLSTSVLARIISGRASDKYGRIVVMRIGTIMLAAALLGFVYADSFAIFIASSCLFGLAAGINSPTIFAWATDLALDEHRGRAMGTLFMALEFGVGLGAVVSGWIFNNNPSQFPTVFGICALCAFAAWIFLFTIRKTRLAYR